MCIMNWIHPGEVAAYIRGNRRSQDSRKSHSRMMDNMA